MRMRVKRERETRASEAERRKRRRRRRKRKRKDAFGKPALCDRLGAREKYTHSPVFPIKGGQFLSLP